MRPLDGITVVALEQAVAVPFASRQLADWGARVIKVERPDSGDFARDYDRTVHGLSSYFVWLGRGKESVALDLKTPLGRTALERLLDRADVLLENLRPGALERLGFEDARVRARWPRLVTCHVSGYGRAGPYRERKAYDLLVQCESGMVALTGTSEWAAKVGTPVADIAAGMYALVGVLLALRRRDATGEGGVVDVAMLDALAEWLGHAMYFARYGGAPPPRAGLHHATIAPYGPYPTGDGRKVFLAVQNEREWQRLCREVLDRPELAIDPEFADNAARVANRTRLDAALAAALAELGADELGERLDRAGIARADMNDVTALARHPQLRARGRWRMVATPVGEIEALLPPVDLWGVEPMLGEVPALGAQTEAVLTECGFSPGEIARLRGADRD